MAVADGTCGGGTTIIDETYEFSAPRFFDFTKGETDDDIRKAELWFHTALSYAPSPFMPKIKAGRSITVDTLCDFSEADNMPKMSESVEDSVLESNTQPHSMISKINEDNEVKEEKLATVSLVTSAYQKDDAQFCKTKEENNSTTSSEDSVGKKINTHKGESLKVATSREASVEVGKVACTPTPALRENVNTTTINSNMQQYSKKMSANTKGESLKVATSIEEASIEVGKDACTPNPVLRKNVNNTTTASKKQQYSKKMSANTKTRLQSEATKSTAGIPHFAQENQAIKRQKLEGGKTRQILNLKPQTLPHNKSKLGYSSSTSKILKEDRKVYVRETPTTSASAPFVSTAEMMKRFQSGTRDLPLPNHTKPKLTLTRPKEPEFETNQRIRPARVKSAAELEDEMMAKMPKFKARPLNKKILQTSTFPPIPRSAPQPPEFKEFHLETMARAHQTTDSASTAASSEVSHKENSLKPHLTEPKPPLLQTSLRARPPTVKSSLELEQEELEKIPKFKARPLNKKIFERKGDIGVFCHMKKNVTEPQEFHFATNERFAPPAVADLFDKLSLKSEPARNNNTIPKVTTPNPFHLHTEERGAEKEKKMFMELLQKQLEDEATRVPKAKPYPYTTDYPVIPPKPEPKQCTKPEPFQLESLVRHEEEMQREQEERLRKEREEAEMRKFKAQPILKEDPIPVPEKVRKPLTQVQEFDLHLNHRAVDRAQFDERVKEKEMIYKRYREESEAARMVEEEKALKQMRRTMVPHARPVPKFDNPFCPQKTSKTTKPKSPNLRVLQRRRKIFNSAVSSPATNMR